MSLQRGIVGNYARSFATAIRNVLDPEDPDTAHYLEQLSSRLNAALVNADERGVTRAELCWLISDAVRFELDMIASGTLNDLRSNIQKKSKT